MSRHTAETDCMPGVRGLELANVGLIECRPNPLVCQNIFVPETFGEEPQKDGRGSRFWTGFSSRKQRALARQYRVLHRIRVLVASQATDFCVAFPGRDDALQLIQRGGIPRLGKALGCRSWAISARGDRLRGWGERTRTRKCRFTKNAWPNSL